MRNEKSRAFHRLAIGVLLSVVLAAPAPAHVSRGYWYDRMNTVTTRHPDWLGTLRGDVKLSQLSLPGTHDTMSFYGGDKVITQSLSLPNQLESGIRVLDIRCRHISDVFAIHHGAVFQNAFFGDVLNDVVAFLRTHKGEAVFMRVMEEFKPSNTTRSFDATFTNHYWYDARWHGFFWQPKAGEDRNNPTLEQVREKIVILQNFPAHSNFGVDYKSFKIQDHWNLGSNWELYDKWLRVKAHLEAANTGSPNDKYMNYLSASGPGPFPYFIASGHSSPFTGAPRLATGRTTPGWRNSWLDFPRVDCVRAFWTNFCTIAFEGTNVLAYERMKYYSRVGVIMADFPGPGLIDSVIALDNRYRK